MQFAVVLLCACLHVAGVFEHWLATRPGDSKITKCAPCQLSNCQ